MCGVVWSNVHIVRVLCVASGAFRRANRKYTSKDHGDEAHTYKPAGCNKTERLLKPCHLLDIPRWRGRTNQARQTLRASTSRQDAEMDFREGELGAGLDTELMADGTLAVGDATRQWQPRAISNPPNKKLK